jgi:translation initiation factor 3 subunit C
LKEQLLHAFKESLAQGSSGFYRQQQERTLEEEIEEKKRFTPPHLQINLEYVEVVYMTTSMLLEIPNISENKFTV